MESRELAHGYHKYGSTNQDNDANNDNQDWGSRRQVQEAHHNAYEVRLDSGLSLSLERTSSRQKYSSQIITSEHFVTFRVRSDKDRTGTITIVPVRTGTVILEKYRKFW